ncbi:MAG: leucine-rich repeat domain-containing protein [Candidatus Poribacteria bacterium]|nr:leucine-rich repeat domain-containing protein [Candidatus Poribacteria bacterium]
MKVWKNLIKISFLLILILGYHTVEAQQNLAQQAYAIFQQNCLTCHGPAGAFRETLLIEHTALIETGAVIPGKPLESEFYRRLIENDPVKRMPQGQPKLSDAAIGTVHNWIQVGAPNWEFQPNVNFITMNAMLTSIQQHVKSLDSFDRPTARYFTMTHLYNAGNSPEILNIYRMALSKLLNSLSWSFDIIKPMPIDAAETIFYVDLRDYKWDQSEAWMQIEEVYPYLIEFDAKLQAGLYGKQENLRDEMECEVPFVHVDWFLANASLPPLYHDILDLPETDRELERELGIDVARNITLAPGRSVWRAGFNDSGPSKHNRVVERHAFRQGAYWKSYDFAGSAGVRNIFTYPLSFKHDGGEVIFNLPNGLQAYYISDGLGNRIDAAPLDIVSNEGSSDKVVRNGLSCIGCHTEGMKTFTDAVRAAIVQTRNPSYNKDHALRLYVNKEVMDEKVREDTQRYKTALEKTGDVFGGIIEPVSYSYESFQAPLDAAHAAAGIGLEAKPFLEKIRMESSLQSLGLTGLLSNGNVKRDVWESNFSKVISSLNSPDDTEVVPVVPVDDLSPSDLVPIPDVNLRAAVEAALGKPAGVLITAADMARLTRIVADERGIRDLTGLKHAVNLERIEFRHNAISDLSPLAGLTRLNNIKLRGNRITDVSPLARLTNVDWLGLEENAITDLSPLKELIKLNGIGISGNPVSDVSPLVSLRSLEGIDAWNTPISDFSVLAKLPRLRWIAFGDDRSVSTIPSLKGLKSLRRLEISDCNISDLSALAELTQLEWLTLVNNLISDVSPLKNLKNLEHLNLDANVISDVSPLAKLTKLKVLYLENNTISDVSPLAGLTNLERLDLRNNAISDFSPLEGLSDQINIRSQGNPGVYLKGGQKIVGPWLWVLLPGAQFESFRSTDLLAQTSRGKVKELEIAANGVTEGQTVGDSVWTSHSISPTSGNNINEMLNALGMSRDTDSDNVVYGSVSLESPREQPTKMFVGSDNNHKVWLNGKLVNQKLDGDWATDYQQSFPVTLKQGKNVLLVAVHAWGGGWCGHFGFAPDAEYRVLPHGGRFSLSTDTTEVKAGATFTVYVKTKGVDDLAGWQSDIIFDPIVLKANNMKDGNFLRQGGGRTHFLKGAIDNTGGRITGVGSARISEGGASGEGTLLSVTFTAKTAGETRVALREFQAGSSTGKAMPSASPDITITVEDPSTLDVSDTAFSLSTDTTSVHLGDPFTLRLRAKDVTDLAGWQSDIAFDPAVLEVVEVSEGDFLRAEGVSTFFGPGTIDNTTGKITNLSTARFKGGVSGTGTLLSVIFTAKAVGETRVTFSNFYAGSSSTEVIPSGSPEIAITVEDSAFLTSDVNRDDQVNVLDLILVAQLLGSTTPGDSRADVNGDGTINVLDLIVVAQHLGESTEGAAPSNVAAVDSLELNPAMIQAWIARARVEDDGSLAFQQGIAKLEQLLALFIPEKTALLHNYPNPFNPETWIPYQLAEPAEVTVHIYAMNGVLVRTLALGYQPAGIYQYRSRAAYWDGKNEVGESVASGVYFYTFTAGDFTATRKMLIMK